MNQPKRILFLSLTVLMSLGLTFIILEGVVRLFDLAPPLPEQYANFVPDSFLPYKPSPMTTLSGRSSNDEYEYTYSHNSFGFRDVEHAHIKDKGVFRIFGLGDSFTYGIGVGFEETYLYQLEKMLNQRQGEHPRIEIVKAGIPRYFSEPERILLEQYGKDYSPDLILVGFLPNDIIDTSIGIDAVVVENSGYLQSSEAEVLGTLGEQLYLRSHLFRVILEKYIGYRISQAYPVRWNDIYIPNGFHEKDWRETESELVRMVAIANEIAADIVFIHIPQIGPWSEKHSYPPRRLAKFATQNSAGFVDILPAMVSAEGSKPLYYLKDGHCTEYGHALIAREVFRYLTESRLVP